MESSSYGTMAVGRKVNDKVGLMFGEMNKIAKNMMRWVTIHSLLELGHPCKLIAFQVEVEQFLLLIICFQVVKSVTSNVLSLIL
jgi:hypothetical protein